ncbi:uridine diphosphate glucose pyrophosphatase [Trichogramma pretiosum]|uniref:uridine diphosphate glucose pyrophosphatase n=1 Tax=Trichogramma pretiosum TaxID=7493 RepID=UPI0006C98573|nr:uridine diphosphate glucose pyrophosphatase [Trichogramma pretiosum]XP_023318397.1 uridine diphosphate glucose pyrophosphatase [Trichogramma pretiosum]
MDYPTVCLEDREKRNHRMVSLMLGVRDITVCSPDETTDKNRDDPPSIPIFRLTYEQFGVQKNWEFVDGKDSFATIVFNTDRHTLVFLRQFCPLTYYAFIPKMLGRVNTNKYPPTLGITIELCGDLLLPNEPLLEMARTELKRDAGYDAPIKNFEIVQSYRCVTDAPATQTLLYVEVTNDMFVPKEELLENHIEIFEMNLEKTKNYISNIGVNSTSSLVHAVLWFLTNKQDRYC